MSLYQSEVAPLRRVVLKHARDAYVSDEVVERRWRDLHYSAPPDFGAACAESEALAALLAQLGVVVDWMPASDAGLDSIYVRDASVISNRGAVLCRMGKEARREEPRLAGEAYGDFGVHVHGGIEAPGTLEGGDVAWLAPDWLAVGVGTRTNEAGAEQLKSLLGEEVEVTSVALPDWRAPGDVFHLMSVLSPIAEDLAIVFPPLLPDALAAAMRERSFSFVEVPESEFAGQGCNVFAVAPRVVVMLDDLPESRRRLEAAGVEVHTYSGAEISLKGFGGPTCLTRPLEREVG